jgi:hypothetical protein
VNRALSLIAALALLLTLTATAEAGKKKKKKGVPGAVVGTITAVADDGKTITVASLTGKKKKKNQAGATEVKLTDKTKVEFIGFANPEERKLAVGQVVLLAMDETSPGTASAVAVGKAGTAKAKGKKKKKNQQ